MKNIALTLVGAAAFVAAGCGSESSMMTDPTGPGGVPVASPSLMSVSLGGGTMGVPVGTALEFHWGTALGAGMEQFIDLHMGNPRRRSSAHRRRLCIPGRSTPSTWEGAWSTRMASWST
jgi:hypothetical protein